MQTTEYWPDQHLPDGTKLPSDMTYRDGLVHGWTGRPCAHCNGTGEDFSQDDLRMSCRRCAGTGEAFGPLYLVEE